MIVARIDCYFRCLFEFCILGEVKEGRETPPTSLLSNELSYAARIAFFTPSPASTVRLIFWS